LKVNALFHSLITLLYFHFSKGFDLLHQSAFIFPRMREQALQVSSYISIALLKIFVVVGSNYVNRRGCEFSLLCGKCWRGEEFCCRELLQVQGSNSSHNMATAVQASNRRVLGDIGNVVVGALSMRCNVNKESVQEWVRILRSLGYRNRKCLGQLPFHS
jgi:hypothetical protein